MDREERALAFAALEDVDPEEKAERDLDYEAAAAALLEADVDDDYVCAAEDYFTEDRPDEVEVDADQAPPVVNEGKYDKERGPPVPRPDYRVAPTPPPSPVKIGPPPLPPFLPNEEPEDQSVYFTGPVYNAAPRPNAPELDVPPPLPALPPPDLEPVARPPPLPAQPPPVLEPVARPNPRQPRANAAVALGAELDRIKEEKAEPKTTVALVPSRGVVAQNCHGDRPTVDNPKMWLDENITYTDANTPRKAIAFVSINHKSTKATQQLLEPLSIDDVQEMLATKNVYLYSSNKELTKGRKGIMLRAKVFLAEHTFLAASQVIIPHNTDVHVVECQQRREKEAILSRWILCNWTEHTHEVLEHYFRGTACTHTREALVYSTAVTDFLSCSQTTTMRVADGQTAIGISSTANSWVNQWMGAQTMSKVWTQNYQIFLNTKAHIVNQLQVIGMLQRESDMKEGTCGLSGDTAYSARLLNLPWHAGPTTTTVETKTTIHTKEATPASPSVFRRGVLSRWKN